MAEKRMEFLDIAKGFGIVFVLFSHSCGFLFGGKGIVSFYMALFFVISGYTYTKKRSVKDNIIRKLKQLLIPYVGFTLLLYIEHILICFIKNDLTRHNILTPLLGALYSRGMVFMEFSDTNPELMIISNSPMWFITAMAAASVLFYVLVDIFLENRKNKVIISAILVAITVAFSYCPIMMPWSIDTAFACCLFMLIGAWLGSINYYSEANKDIYSLWYIILSFVVYLIITQAANPINLSLRDYGYSGIIGVMWFLAVSLTGSIIFLWLCKYMEGFRINRVITLIGKHTYTIMALHILMFKYLTKLYYVFGMSFEFTRNNIFYWIYWIVVFSIVIVGCIILDSMLSFIKGLKIWRIR